MRVTPIVARTPRCAAVSSVPISITGSPGFTSSPAGRMCWSTVAVAVTTTVSPSGEPSVSSTITIALAPGGTGAPVMIRTAQPDSTGDSTPDMPARTVPVTRRVTGTVAVSMAITAYPSTAVFAKGGTCSAATTASAVTQPRASFSATTT